MSDYGTVDEFAGVMRAAVARVAPGAPLVDLTHDVPAFDVRAGALTLLRAAPHLGPGVVLAVVDPGVGTTRRGVALATSAAAGPTALVGPDNGLLVWAAEALGGVQAAVALRRGPGASATFDGRDVFGPAAAALWNGSPLESVGDPIDPADLTRLRPPHVECSAGRLSAEVLWIDRFGNIQLAATPEDVAGAGLLDRHTLELVLDGGRMVGVRVVSAFGELAGTNDPGVLVDANGHLAVVCERQPAATVLGVQSGETVTLRLPAGGRP